MIKELYFIGSSKEDISVFPEEVKLDIGYALFVAQRGEKSETAKPLKGFGGTGFWRLLKDSTAILIAQFIR